MKFKEQFRIQKEWLRRMFTFLSLISFIRTLLIWPRLKKKLVTLDLHKITYLHKEKQQLRGSDIEFWLCEYDNIFSFYLVTPLRQIPRKEEIGVIFKDYLYRV